LEEYFGKQALSREGDRALRCDVATDNAESPDDFKSTSKLSITFRGVLND
jgi:hypothetical protein